jgi:short-subunit dehydrogenase
MTSAARPLAIVTGASEGIGRDLADCYAHDRYDLVLVARRQALLEELATALRRAHGVTIEVFPADLSRADERERLIQALQPQRQRVRALVNNAGIGTHGWFHDIPIDRQQALIDINISALTQLTSAVLPWLRANGAGHVMNVASTASFQPGPLMATYYASKAYVLSLSEALHNECRGTGVTVTVVCPGPTRTGFQRAAGIAPGARSGGAPAMDSATVARLAYNGTKARKRVVVTGFRNKFAAFIGRFFPRAWTANAVRSIQLSRLSASDPAGPTKAS